jgi:excisionase family DNA binding protein
MSIQSCGLGKTGGLKPITVTVPVTREITGLGNTTVWALIRDGKLRTIKIGKRRLVIYQSIEELLLGAAGPEL